MMMLLTFMSLDARWARVQAGPDVLGLQRRLKDEFHGYDGELQDIA
jgi:hypothetical protein